MVWGLWWGRGQGHLLGAVSGGGEEMVCWEDEEEPLEVVPLAMSEPPIDKAWWGCFGQGHGETQRFWDIFGCVIWGLWGGFTGLLKDIEDRWTQHASEGGDEIKGEGY